MKANWIQRAGSSRYIWAALGGLCLAASFPKLGIAGLAWVAPGWILFSAQSQKGSEVGRIGYVGGLAYGLGAFYWILCIPYPAGAIAGWLALGAYLGLYTAAWVWLCWRVCPGRPRSFRELAAVSVAQRVVWAFACAMIWVGVEMILARMFTGFPWNLLGVSQYQMLPLIQIGVFTGVYGISFLVVWFSVSLANAGVNLVVNPRESKSWVGDLILPLLVLLVTIAVGSTELAKMPPVERTLKTVLIQPSIPQTLIWDTNQNAIRFTQLLELSERALERTSNAQLLVWPEAALPNMLRFELDTYQAVTNLAITRRVWMILGSDDAAPRFGSDERDVDYFNSSFLISPQGEIVSSYRKRRLVIFGEYIPLEHWFPLMKYLTPVGGSFTPGRGPRPFTVPELKAKISVLICFEDIFPHLTCEYIEADTDFLLNLTNNGWFGESAAQWQHAANAVIRAVENRIPLVRCANNGLTCWVDAYGGMHEVYFRDSRNVYGAGYKTVDVPLLPAGHKRQLTFYTRHGDWFGWGCVTGTGLVLASVAGAELKARRQQPRIG